MDKERSDEYLKEMVHGFNVYEGIYERKGEGEEEKDVKWIMWP